MILSELQPTLHGPTVTVRPLRADDWPEMFAAAADPLIWAQHPAHDRWREPVFRRFFDEALAGGSAFAITDQAGAIIGSTRFANHDPARREIELGWTFLVRARWGGPTNAEVKRLLTAHAFGFVDTVVFWVGEANHRSRRALEKLGATLRPGTRHRDPTAPPSVIYELRRPGFDLAR